MTIIVFENENSVQQESKAKPVGSVLAFAGDRNKIPSGWLLCNGAEVSRIDYQELFSIIGTTHGGDLQRNPSKFA